MVSLVVAGHLSDTLPAINHVSVTGAAPGWRAGSRRERILFHQEL
jgi:hypothetical protein